MANLKHYVGVTSVLKVVAALIDLNPLSGGSFRSIRGRNLSGGEVAGCNGAMLEISGSEHEILELHSEARTGHGDPELCYQENLADAAHGHSEDMLERDYLGHDYLEDQGPADRMLAGYDRGGYHSWRVAENIYKTEGPDADPNTETLESVVNGWMESSGHQENISAPELREIGFGVATDGFSGTSEETALYVANFGMRE